MMKKCVKIASVLCFCAVSSFASEIKTDIKKDMAAQEAAMASIQKALLYSSKDGVKDGVKALKDANKVATLKDHLPSYLPENKKALAKNAMQQGENVNKNADAMLKALEENKFKDAFESYGKLLNSCNTCHVVIRSWK